MTDKLFGLLARGIARRRVSIIWITLGLFVLMLYPLRHIHFSTDVLELIPQELVVLQTFRELDRHFVQGGDLAILIESPPGESDSLEAFERSFLDALRAIPEIKGVAPTVGSSVDAAGWRWLWERFWLMLAPKELDALMGKLDPARIREAVHQSRVRLEASPSAMMVQHITYDPIGVSEVFTSHVRSTFSGNAGTTSAASSDRGPSRILSLLTTINLNDSHACIRLVESVRRAEQQVRDQWSRLGRDHSHIQVGHTGRVAFTAEIASKLRWNMISNALMALVLVLFLFWLAFRNLYPLFAIGATLVMAVLVNVVLTGLIFGGFNVITGSFAAILVGLGDYGILIYNRYSLAMNSAGPGSDARSDEATKEAAILYTARCTVPGILLGASTTAAAFLCTSWTSSPGFRQFGVVVAMGVAVCAVLMIVFYFSLIAGPTPRGVESDVFGRLLRPLGEAVATHARAVRIGSLLAILAALLVVLGGSRPGVGFDADPQSLRFRHSPASTTLDKVLTRLDRTANPCVLLISGSDWGEVAETTGQLRARLEQAKANGIVHLFESPSALLPPLSQQRENARRLALLDWPAIRDAFQQALVAEGFRPDQFQSTVAWLQAAERYGAAPEPVLLTPSQWLEHGGESSLVLGRYVYSGTGVVQTATYVYPTKPLDSVGAIESLSAQLGVDDDRVRLTNWDALILEMQPLFRRDFLRISLVVFVVVVVIIWSGYRRFKPLGLLAIPVAGAVAGILAVMKVCGIKFNLANFFAVPIVIGAGVDYAIHMFNGVEEEGGDGKAAIRVTGKAVVVNALTTMIGFGSLMMTDHTGLATLGLLTTLGIFFCLIFSVVALP